jgi:hypothetical protein
MCASGMGDTYVMELKYCRRRLRECSQTRTQTWHSSTTTVSIIYCAVFVKYTENRNEGNSFMRKFTADIDVQICTMLKIYAQTTRHSPNFGIHLL